MIYPGFIGPTYQSRSLIADAEDCINLYPEKVESGAGKNDIVLYGTPGNTRLGFHPPDGTYLPIPGGEIIGMKTVWSKSDGGYSAYAVTASTQIGSSAARTITLVKLINFGASAVATLPGTSNYPPRACWMSSNGTQLLILLKTDNVNSLLYCYTFSSGSLAQVTSWDSTQVVTGLDFLDGFFIITTTQSLYASASGDGTSWNALNFINVSDEPDSIVGLLVQQRLIWVFGRNRTETYYNAGGTDFPFQRVPQGVIETGCLCAASIVAMGDSIMWLGTDQRGGLTVWRNQGYNAIRVSTHAVENILAPYFKSADVVNPNGGVAAYGGAPAMWMGLRAYAYREDGHLFYVLNLGGPNSSGTNIFGFATPTAPTTPVYDLTTGLWHTRQSWDGTANTRHLGNFYCFDQNLGGHVVSDYRFAVIYLMANGTYTETENNNLITRQRTAPHLATENKLNFYSKFTLDCEVGTETGSNQSLTLYWSNDGGQTWSAGSTFNGYTGGFVNRFSWWRLGAARDRVFRVTTNSAMQVAWINAYLELTTGRS